MRGRVLVFGALGTALLARPLRCCPGEAIEETLVRSLPAYRWYKQVVGAHQHLGKPMRRERAFWVGTRGK